jgi:putative ABC transport system permease protein
MPPKFDFPSRDTALWLPMSLDPANPFSLWSANALTLVGRLREGRDIGTARQETRTLIPTFRDLFPFYLKMPDGYGADAAVHPLHEEVVGDVRTELLILLTAIGAVLLILCVNVANLLLARGISRDRELVTRAALGAGRGRLIRQLLAEKYRRRSAVGRDRNDRVAGMPAHASGIPLPAELPRIEEIQLDTRVLLFALGVSIATGLAFGLLPAIRTTREGHGLLARGTGGALVEGREGRLTSGLAALQFSLAVVLVVSAALLLQSLWNLTAVDPGFQIEGLVSARIAPSGSPDELNDDLLTRLEDVPGVVSTAVATSVPFGNDAMRVGFGIEGGPEAGNVPTVADVAVGISAGYLKTMGIPLLEGRRFTETDGPGSAPVALVTRSLART